MKGSDEFKRIIAGFLRNKALNDPLFAKSCIAKKDRKNINECIEYILSEVKKSGCCGFADEEIYSMAVHYYDEDDIKIEKVGNGSVVVNHHVELSEEEKAAAKEAAMKRLENELFNKMKNNKSKSSEQPSDNQLSLF